MSTDKTMRFGLVGSGGRGSSTAVTLKAFNAKVHAVCDTNVDILEESKERLGASEAYSDYAEMLEKSELDAVFIGTPMPLHCEQSVMALDKGIHVLCEVPAAVSVDECRQIVHAASKSEAVFMLAENYTYRKPNVIVRHLVDMGLFGDVYYAEGEYLHELKELNEKTKWRRKWQTGIAGVTYGTHSLGPILQWMPNDRVIRVCCDDASPRYKDPRGDYYAQTTPVMLCKTAKGALIKIRVDMVSDRPHAMTNYSLQGTDGAYESSRGGPVDKGKIWLRELSKDIKWLDADSLGEIDELAAKYLPELWRNASPEAQSAGHGGGDYFQIKEFMDAVRGLAPCPIDVHRAMDMTLPGLISQLSVLQEGAWLDVPDSRDWA